MHERWSDGLPRSHFAPRRVARPARRRGGDGIEHGLGVDPVQTGVETILAATVVLIGDVTQSVAKAMVALFVGVAFGTVAVVLYAVFRPVETQVLNYFSAASQVGFVG
jgi:hypothetical protein